MVDQLFGRLITDIDHVDFGSRNINRGYLWSMKMLTARFFVTGLFFAAAAVSFANPFKSKIITGNDSMLVITVPEDHFMKITNFTQDGGTDRGVVEVTLQGDTENGGTANVLTATRIDFSTGSNTQNAPEIGNRVTIAGPAVVRIRPVVGAKLFISYKKERDEGSGGGGGGGGGASPTPIPIVSPTPSVTPTPTLTPFPFPTLTPFPSPTP
jgi:hypothetical protein